MAAILTVTANPLLDHLARAPWRPGAVARTASFERIAGGKGVNVARVLARHGHRVAAVCLGGGAEAGILERLVAADGVEPVLVGTAARLRIGFQVADGGAGSVACIEDGFAVEPDERERLVAEVRRRLPGAGLLIISGSVPDVRLDDLYRRLCDEAVAAGVPCWLDSYGRPMLAALAGANPPALVKPNAREYAGDSAPWLAARELHLTDGPAAVTVRSPEGRWRVLPPKVAEVNPIGSGDCWLAGYAHGRLSGWDAPRALAWAAAAGAANAATAAVACVGPEDIRPLLAQVQVLAAE